MHTRTAMDMYKCTVRSIYSLCLFIVLIESAKWDYEGEAGVHHWHELFPQACSGRYQSPINIHREKTIYSSKLRDFAIWYDPPKVGTIMKIKNNGHSIKVGVEGDFFVTNGGLPNVYKTAQFHLHWGGGNFHGSEHLIDGKQYPLELHVVNYNSDLYNDISEAVTEPKGLAVLGTLFEISEQDNPVLEPLVEQLRKIRHPDSEAVMIEPISIRYFLPRDIKKYYRYQGSLTTPGCFESVIWTVFEDTLPISERQLNEFRKVLKPHKKHKKSKHHKRESAKLAEEAVLEELGIATEKEAQVKLEMNLEKSTLKEGGAEEVREPSYMVNNYRPVQPLNGRNVYRSYRFIGNYRVEATKNGYKRVGSKIIHKKNHKAEPVKDDDHDSAAVVATVSQVAMLFSVVFVYLLK